MKRLKFTKSQIAFTLRQGEGYAGGRGLPHSGGQLGHFLQLEKEVWRLDTVGGKGARAALRVRSWR